MSPLRSSTKSSFVMDVIPSYHIIHTSCPWPPNSKYQLPIKCNFKKSCYYFSFIIIWQVSCSAGAIVWLARLRMQFLQIQYKFKVQNILLRQITHHGQIGAISNNIYDSIINRHTVFSHYSTVLCSTMIS